MLELFVTGVEQNPDKVVVNAGLLAVMQSLGYSTAVYKPVDTGAIENLGFIQSKNLSFIKFVDPYIKTYFSYLLKAEFVPLLAAAAEGLVIDKEVILKDFQSIQDKHEILLLEGVSGLTTPLSKNFLEEDIIKMLDLPVLFCVCAKENSINNVLLAVERAKAQRVNIRGIIINNFSETTDNADIKLLPKLIEEYTGVKVLGTLPPIERDINPNELINIILNNVDVEAVFNIHIAKLN